MSPEKHGTGYPFDCSPDTSSSNDEVDVLTGMNTIKQMVQELSDSRRSSMTANLKLLRDLITDLISMEEKRKSQGENEPTSEAEPTSVQSANSVMVCEIIECFVCEDLFDGVPPSSSPSKTLHEQESISKQEKKSDQQEHRAKVNRKTQSLPTTPEKIKKEENIVQKPDSHLKQWVRKEEVKVEKANESINKEPETSIQDSSLQPPKNQKQDQRFMNTSSAMEFADEGLFPWGSFSPIESYGSASSEVEQREFSYLTQTKSAVSKSKSDEQKLIADQRNDNINEISMVAAAVQTSFTSEDLSKDAEAKEAEKTVQQQHKTEIETVQEGPYQIQTIVYPPPLKELSFAAAPKKRKKKHTAAVKNIADEKTEESAEKEPRTKKRKNGKKSIQDKEKEVSETSIKDTADEKAEKSAQEEDRNKVNDRTQPPLASHRSKRLFKQEALRKKAKKRRKDKHRKVEKEESQIIPTLVVVATQTSFIYRVPSKDNANEEINEEDGEKHRTEVNDTSQSSPIPLQIKKSEQAYGRTELNDSIQSLLTPPHTEKRDLDEDGTATEDKIQSSPTAPHKKKSSPTVAVQTSSSGLVFYRKTADEEAKDNIKVGLVTAKSEKSRSKAIIGEDRDDMNKEVSDNKKSSAPEQSLLMKKDGADEEAEERVKKKNRREENDKILPSLPAPHKKKSSVAVAVQTSSPGKALNKATADTVTKDNVKEGLANVSPDELRSQNVIREDQEDQRKEVTGKIQSSPTTEAQTSYMNKERAEKEALEYIQEKDRIESNYKIQSSHTAPHLKKPSVAVAVQTLLNIRALTKKASESSVNESDRQKQENSQPEISKKEAKEITSKKLEHAEHTPHINKSDQEDDRTAVNQRSQLSLTEAQTKKSSVAVAPTAPYLKKPSIAVAVQTFLNSRAHMKKAPESLVNESVRQKQKNVQPEISKEEPMDTTSRILEHAKHTPHINKIDQEDDGTAVNQKSQPSHTKKSSVAVQTLLIRRALNKNGTKGSVQTALENAKSKDERRVSISNKLGFFEPVNYQQEIIQKQKKILPKPNGDLTKLSKEKYVEKPKNSLSKEQTILEESHTSFQGKHVEPDKSNSLRPSNNFIQDQEFADVEPSPSKSSISADSQGSSSGEEDNKEFDIAIQKRSFEPNRKKDEHQIIGNQSISKQLEKIKDQNKTKELYRKEDQEQVKETKKDHAVTKAKPETKIQQLIKDHWSLREMQNILDDTIENSAAALDGLVDKGIQTDITKFVTDPENDASISPTDPVDTAVQSDHRKDSQKTREELLDKVRSDVNLIHDQKEIAGYSTYSVNQIAQQKTTGSEKNKEENDKAVITSELDNNAIAREEDDDDFENIEDEIFKSNGKECPPDRRLELWQRTVEARQRIAENIMNQTGKRQSDVLFNRLLTSEEQDKQMVQRIMDCADRISATMAERPLKLRAYINERNQYISDLDSTVPRLRKKLVISGVPDMVKKEIIGSYAPQGTYKSRWMKSPVLAKRINEKQRDIRRVIDFYPDISCLSVAGITKPIMMHFHTGQKRRYCEQKEMQNSCYYGVQSFVRSIIVNDGHVEKADTTKSKGSYQSDIN